MKEAEIKNDFWAALFLVAAEAIFIFFWASLTIIIGYCLWNIYPAVKSGSPAAWLAALLLAPQFLFLLQGLFYLPAKNVQAPIFISCRFFRFRLAFLPFPRRLIMDTGPGFEAVAGEQDRMAIIAAHKNRIRFSAALSLAFLLDNRSPLDCILKRLKTAPGFRLLFGFLYLLASPARQFASLWGFLFFQWARKFADPGPMDELSAYKCFLAHDLVYRAKGLSEPLTAENLIHLRQALALVFDNPDYGRRLGGDLPYAKEDFSGSYYQAPFLASKYRGAYLDLPATLGARRPDELYDRSGVIDDPALFYPPQLGREMEELILLSAEKKRLTDLLAGRDWEGYLLVDGRPTLSWELLDEIDDLEARLLRLRQRLAAHHLRCRSSHMAAAQKIGWGWPEYLEALGGLLFLAEQVRAALDLTLKNYGDSEEEVFSQAAGTHRFFNDIYLRLKSLNLPKELEFPTSDFNADIDWGPRTKLDRLNWWKYWQGHGVELSASLEILREKVLTALLAAEEKLDDLINDPEPQMAPETLAWQPSKQSLISPARPIEPQQSSYRVYSKAEQLGAGFSQGLLTALLLSLIIWQSLSLGQSHISVYNGLGRHIQVMIDERSLSIPPFGTNGLSLRPDGLIRVTALADGQLVESFEKRLFPYPAKEVYNIGGAAPLTQWVSPRLSEAEEGLFLGRPRWLLTKADALFMIPPAREKSRPRLILSAYGEASPDEILAAFDEADQVELIALHARWDPLFSPWFWQWQSALLERPGLIGVFIERLKHEADYGGHFLSNAD